MFTNEQRVRRIARELGLEVYYRSGTIYFVKDSRAVWYGGYDEDKRESVFANWLTRGVDLAKILANTNGYRPHFASYLVDEANQETVRYVQAKLRQAAQSLGTLDLPFIKDELKKILRTKNKIYLTPEQAHQVIDAFQIAHCDSCGATIYPVSPHHYKYTVDGVVHEGDQNICDACHQQDIEYFKAKGIAYE